MHKHKHTHHPYPIVHNLSPIAPHTLTHPYTDCTSPTASYRIDLTDAYRLESVVYHRVRRLCERAARKVHLSVNAMGDAVAYKVLTVACRGGVSTNREVLSCVRRVNGLCVCRVSVCVCMCVRVCVCCLCVRVRVCVCVSVVRVRGVGVRVCVCV